MNEETLGGGNTVGGVRIGDVVHKHASPWTPTVHALLRHLEDAGFDGAPRALGFDDQGIATHRSLRPSGRQIPWTAIRRFERRGIWHGLGAWLNDGRWLTLRSGRART